MAKIVRIRLGQTLTLLRLINSHDKPLRSCIGLRLFQRVEFQFHLIGGAVNRIPACIDIFAACAFGSKFQYPMADLAVPDDMAIWPVDKFSQS